GLVILTHRVVVPAESCARHHDARGEQAQQQLALAGGLRCFGDRIARRLRFRSRADGVDRFAHDEAPDGREDIAVAFQRALTTGCVPATEAADAAALPRAPASALST